MDQPENEIKMLVEKFGVENQHLITESIKWLNENEPYWDLDEPINRIKWIRELIKRTVK